VTRLAYLDCFSGAAGDMVLGAIVDAGLPLRDLERALKPLRLGGWKLRARRVERGPVACRKVDVVVKPGHRHVRAAEVLRTVRRLPAPARDSAVRVFERLAAAEGKVHGVPAARVEFHEVGAIDAILDVAGACLGLRLLGIDRLHASPLPFTRGSVATEHGTLPVPAPATVELMKGWPTFGLDVARELVTPTGAALVTTLATPAPFPEMTIEAVGCGAGDDDAADRPDFLRLVVGAAADPETTDVAWLVETNLDNASGELVGWLFERLFAAGALDVFTTPIQMKKSRPAVTISVLAPPSRLRAIEETLLVESPTFGVRRSLVERRKLAREERVVRTRYGPIRVKVGRMNGRVVRTAPEYEDVRAAALKHRVPLSAVLSDISR